MAKDPKIELEGLENAVRASDALKASTDAGRRSVNSLGTAISKQVSIAQQMSQAYEDGASTMDRMRRSSNKFAKDFNRELSKSGKTTKSLDKAVSMLADDLEKMGKKGAFAAGVLRGMQDAAKSLGKAFGVVKTSAISLFKSFVKFNVDLILSPIKLIDSVMKTADKAARMGAAIANQSNQLANQFGGNASIVRDIAKDFKKSEGIFGNTFAYMTGEHFAAAGKAAGDMGNYFFGMTQQVAKSGKALFVLNRVLNFGAEEMQGMALTAKTSGKSITELTNEYVQMGAAMSRSTGVAQQIIAKDMAGIQKDVATFGHQTAEAAAVMSARMRTLGSDFKTLGKVVNKFMNFDQASKSAAMLGQAFGVNIDAMKMMRLSVKDPIKAMEHLRKGFFAAGRDASTMNAAQLKVLASATGMGEEEAKLLFSMKNRGKSVKDLKKSAKSQLSDTEKQTAALAELGRQMAKLAEVISTGGIFENLSKGFEDVMIESGDLGKFQNLNQVFYQTGKELGRVFLRLVDSGVFDKLMDAMKGILPLVKILGKRGGFFDKIFSGDGAGAMKDLDKAFKKVFGGSFQGMIEEAMAFLVNNAANMLNVVADILLGALGEMGSGKSQGKLAAAFGNLFAAWGKIWQAIKPSVIKIIDMMFDALIEWAKANPGKVLAIIAIFSGPKAAAMVAVAGAGMASGFVTNFVNFIKGVGPLVSKTISGVFALPTKILDKISMKFTWIDNIRLSFMELTDKIKKMFSFKSPKWITSLSQGVTSLGDKFKPVLEGFKNISGWFSKQGKAILTFGSKFKFLSKLGKVFKFFKFIGSEVLAIVYVVVGAFKGVWKSVEAGGGIIEGLFAGIAEGANAFIFSFYDFAEWIAGFFGMSMEDTWLGKWVQSVRDAWDALDFSYVGETFMFMLDEVWTTLKEWGSNIWDGITEPFIAAWDWLFGDTIWSGDTVGAIWESITDVIGDFKDKIIDRVTAPFKAAADFVGGMKDRFKKAAGSIVDGVTGGIKKGYNKIKDAGKAMGNKIKDGFKGLLGIRSKSTVMEGFGGDVVGGLESGIVKNLPEIMKLGKKMADALGFQDDGSMSIQTQNAMEAFKSVEELLGNIKGIFETMMELKSTIDKMTCLFADTSLGAEIKSAFDTLDAVIPTIAERMRSTNNLVLANTKTTETMAGDRRKAVEAARAATARGGGARNVAAKAAGEAFDASNKSDADLSGLADTFLSGFFDMMNEFEKIITVTTSISAKLKGFKITGITSSIEDAVGKMIVLGKALPELTKDLNRSDVNAANWKLFYFWCELDYLNDRFGYIADNMKADNYKRAEQAAAGLTHCLKNFNNMIGGSPAGGGSPLTEWLKDTQFYTGQAADLSKSAADNMKALQQNLFNLNRTAWAIGDAIDPKAFIYADWRLYDSSSSINMMMGTIQDDLFDDFVPKVWEHRIKEAEMVIKYTELLVDRLHRIKTIIGGIPAIHLRATIDDIKDNMSIVKEFTKIKDKPINIQFALDIHMSSDKLTKAILNSKRGQKIVLKP